MRRWLLQFFLKAIWNSFHPLYFFTYAHIFFSHEYIARGLPSKFQYFHYFDSANNQYYSNQIVWFVKNINFPSPICSRGKWKDHIFAYMHLYFVPIDSHSLWAVIIFTQYHIYICSMQPFALHVLSLVISPSRCCVKRNIVWSILFNYKCIHTVPCVTHLWCASPATAQSSVFLFFQAVNRLHIFSLLHVRRVHNLTGKCDFLF